MKIFIEVFVISLICLIVVYGQEDECETTTESVETTTKTDTTTTSPSDRQFCEKTIKDCIRRMLLPTWNSIRRCATVGPACAADVFEEIKRNFDISKYLPKSNEKS